MEKIMPAQVAKKDQLINMRVNRSTRDFIDRAAKSIGKGGSQFILDAAYDKAEEILRDRTEFFLDDAQWVAFNRILDNPPEPNEKLVKLLAAKAPWE